jgi:hypothetical protein
MAARLSACAVVWEAETTCKWLEGLAAIPEGERPTPEQVADLERVIDHRIEQLDREVRSMLGALQGAMSATLLLAERPWEGDAHG